MVTKIRGNILSATWDLLKRFPDREMRAVDVRDWLVAEGSIPASTWTQDCSKALSNLVAQGGAVRTVKRGQSPDRYVWYALKL